MATPADGSTKTANTTSIRKQIRGSMLLLGGRGCSLLMSLVTQIIIVRALSRTDYGALAYSISIVESLSVISLIALDKTVLRFGAIYHEQKDFPRFAGSLVLATLVPSLLGGAIVAALVLGGSSLAHSLSLDSISWPLLMAICLLIPVNGFASVSLSLITIVKGARSVFFRKHLFSPAFKLILVTAAAATTSDPQHIAVALLIAGLCGLLADLWLVRRLLISEKLTTHFSFRRIVLPFRELIGYSLSVLASDLSFMVRSTLLVVLLGWLGSSEETAALRATLPLVRLNQLVLLNFMTLFVPNASRSFAGDNIQQLWETHRQTNLWIMALSFPVFAVTAALARPLTLLMFGSAYADASLLLVVLSTGYYVQAMYGLNGHLLRILGHVRLLLAVDIVGGTLLMTTAAVTIPIWGAVGAATAAACGIVVHSHLRSLVLRHVGGLKCDQKSRPAVFVTAFMVAVVTSVSVYWSPDWIAGSILAAAASVVVLFVTRERLNIDESFPEIRRIPFASLLLPAACQEPTTTLDSGVEATRLAHMMSWFPGITKTFVLRKMIKTQQMGVRVRASPLQRERTNIVHPEAAEFVEASVFTPVMSIAIASANVRSVLRNPVRYVSTIVTLVRTNRGSRGYLTGAVALFPKAVYLGDQMQRGGVQHLHAHFASHSAMVAWVIHRLTGFPFSFTAHGSDLHRDRHMLRQKVADATATVTISDYNRDVIIEECGPESAHGVDDVHCGIEPQLFSARFRPTAFDQGLGSFQMACIGTLHEVNGQEYLLKACGILLNDGFDFVCHLIGDGPDREMLEDLVTELGLCQQVVFHGRPTAGDIRTVLAEVDVVVAPSVPPADGRREGIPVVLMEGLGPGIPAIGSDSSGIPELVRPHKTGLLTPSHDAAAIADALLLMATDPELRKRCATAGSELVLEEFHVATNTKVLWRLIQDRSFQQHADIHRPGQEPAKAEDTQNVEAECLV